MKLKTVLMGILILLLLWVLLPFLFIKFNKLLNLTIYDLLQFKIVGLLLITAAMCMDIYLFVLFKVYGKGTPVPVEPTQKLIFQGLYRKTRNPMYLGHLTIYLGLFLYFGHLTLLFLFFIATIFFQLLVTKWEEPNLKKRLGKEYIEYTGRVPRWI